MAQCLINKIVARQATGAGEEGETAYKRMVLLLSPISPLPLTFNSLCHFKFRVVFRNSHVETGMDRCIVLLALVATIGLPYVQMRREQARRNTCDFAQAELGQALFRAHELQSALPGYREAETFVNVSEPQAVAWTFVLLPYLGLSATEQELANQQFSAQRQGKYHVVQEHWLAGNKSSDTQELWIKPLCCPAVKLNAVQPARIQFVANCGLPDAPATNEFPADWPANGVFQDRFSTSAHPVTIAQPLSLEEVEARDGRGSTLLFTENIDAGEWTHSEEFRIGFIWLAQARDGQLQRDPQLLGINQRGGEGDVRWPSQGPRVIIGVV